MDIKNIQKLVNNDGIVFLSYGGFLSQELISAMTDALENEAKVNDVSMGVSNNIFMIFIELAQNMLNYSKNNIVDSRDINPYGLIVVSKNSVGNYCLHSQNIIAVEDKEKLEVKLIEIASLNKDEIKARYKELRRSGRNTHGKGGGIGLYEIAKKCDGIDYEFVKINDDKYEFYLRIDVNLKKEVRNG